MTDEQPVVPQPPEQPHTSKLERLPDDIKKELDELIIAGNGSQITKDLLEKKFPGRTDLLPADRSTYWVYMKENKERLQGEANLRHQLLDFSKEEMELVQQNITVTQEASVTGDIKDIRVSLQNLQTFMAKRIDELTKLQSGASPMNRSQYESYIGAYVKEMHSILGTLLKHQTELKDNVEEQFVKRSQQMYYLVVKAGLDAYKMSKSYEEFLVVFEDRATKILHDFAVEDARKNP